MTLQILIADDHPVYRVGLVHILSQQHDCHCLQACDGGEAIDMIRQHQPDMALLDISMPRTGGLDVLAQTRAKSPATRFIILTMFDDYKLIERAFDLGADGYLLKEDAEEELLYCLQTVQAGHRYLSDSIFLSTPTSDESDIQQQLQQLTPAEQRIARLVGQFKTSREIAEELGISVRTVQNHRSHISEKLGLNGNNALLRFMKAAG
jgi:DNA-binding NarL/FixJ family response regulator